MSGWKPWAACCLITTVVIFFIFFAIYVTRVLPSIMLEEFVVPGVNTTTTNNHTIYINLRLKNRNPATGLHYDPLYLNISFIPNHQNTSFSLGEYRMHGFYQGNGKTKHVMGLLMTRGLSANLTNNGVFRVDLFGKVRYKLVGYRKRHKMKLSADVEVDDKTGKKVEEKGIRLVKSAGS